MRLSTIFFSIACSCTIITFVFSRKCIADWFRHQYRKHKLRKVIHQVQVDLDADPDALAFALAVSSIHSRDLYAASEILPASKNRFVSKQKREIAEEAFMLRTVEHNDFYWNPENYHTSLHERVKIARRKALVSIRPEPAVHEPPRDPLIREIRESLREMVRQIDSKKTLAEPEPVMVETNRK